jgi:uncharacterized protein YqhQ
MIYSKTEPHLNNLMKGTPPKIDFAIGGQAVIEGVMMRSPNFITVAVRKEKGDIKLKEEPYKGLGMKVKVLGIPILRGVVNMIEMMIVGMRILNYSANEQMDEEEIKKEENKWMKVVMAVSFAFSIIFALGLSLFLFKFLPLWITDYFSKQYGLLNSNYIYYNLLDGILKTSFFIVYIAILSLLPSIKRVFEYHGAEHKSIYNYESGLPLNVANARNMSRFHPRCGTSFILIVFLISIFIYTFVPKQSEFTSNFLVRLLFLPLIAGVSYEFLKWSGKHRENIFMKILIAPGLWFQRLTTREPTDRQLEVALGALQKALELEKEKSSLKQEIQPA